MPRLREFGPNTTAEDLAGALASDGAAIPHLSGGTFANRLGVSLQPTVNTSMFNGGADSVAWDGEEWLVCPCHRLREYQAAVLSGQTLSVLHEDVILEIIALLGM
jgi:hypothetical protein